MFLELLYTGLSLDAKLSEQEFIELAGRTRLKSRALSMARLVLVDGLPPRVAAEKHGVTRQAAEKAAKRVIMEKRRKNQIPDDWKAGTWILPPELDEFMQALAAKEYKRQGITVIAQETPVNLKPQTVEDIAEILDKWRKMNE